MSIQRRGGGKFSFHQPDKSIPMLLPHLLYIQRLEKKTHYIHKKQKIKSKKWQPEFGSQQFGDYFNEVPSLDLIFPLVVDKWHIGPSTLPTSAEWATTTDMTGWSDCPSLLSNPNQDSTYIGLPVETSSFLLSATWSPFFIYLFIFFLLIQMGCHFEP